MSPLKAIRQNCIECCNGMVAEVRKCELTKCPLHPFRFGKNPFRKKREMTEEQRKALSERLKKGREKSVD